MQLHNPVLPRDFHVPLQRPALETIAGNFLLSLGQPPAGASQEQAERAMSVARGVAISLRHPAHRRAGAGVENQEGA